MAALIRYHLQYSVHLYLFLRAFQSNEVVSKESWCHLSGLIGCEKNPATWRLFDYFFTFRHSIFGHRLWSYSSVYRVLYSLRHHSDTVGNRADTVTKSTAGTILSDPSEM